MANSISSLLRRGSEALATTSASARLDAELLLARVLQAQRSELYAHPQKSVADEIAHAYLTLIKRRASGEPLAYITGDKEFWSLTFMVSEATLIPRPETELLVEIALAHAAPQSRLADLGTGSGAIAVALATERPEALIVATDISAAALELASKNASAHRADNIEFRLAEAGDWTSVLGSDRFDLVVSNPPYVDADDPALESSDIRYEPRAALAADDGGYHDLRMIIANVPTHLRQGGWLMLEHGNRQGPAVREMFSNSGFKAVATHADLAGHERVTIGQLACAQA